jgi:Sulfotransferase family
VQIIDIDQPSAADSGEHAMHFLKTAFGKLPITDKEITRIHKMRSGHIIPVEQPLFLVSQISRSGGSLMAQLFDGHPECHTHPGELHIGYPKKYNWPDLDLKQKPDKWFEMLFERRLPGYAEEGFVKVPRHMRSSYSASQIRYPFLFLPKLQREIFRKCATQGIRSQRDIINCYMTSYFNAWLDYQDLYRGERKCVFAFTPRLSMYEDSVERFFRDYPDGKMVTIVRDPKTWFVSFVKRKPEERGNITEAMTRWNTSAQAALNNRQRWRNRVILLTFEDLLQDPETTMRHLTQALGLTFDKCLLTPTFQGMPIRANSTFRVEKDGVLDTPLQRAGALTPAEVDGIERETSSLYAKVLAEIENASYPS